jgi:hypothetical protein
MDDEAVAEDARGMDSDPTTSTGRPDDPDEPDAGWLDGIDVFEHHCIDFDHVAAHGVDVTMVRAGRGTRQDGRWIEHVRAAERTGLGVGSYWHVYPSRTDAHHQAELWASAIHAAGVPFGYGHWADISAADGLDRTDLGRFVAAFLRRADELVGEHVGVFSPPDFWLRHVGFDDPGRPRWAATAPAANCAPEAWATLAGVRLTPSDRGGPGQHRVRPVAQSARDPLAPTVVARGSSESVEQWRSRWKRSPEIAALQIQLNEFGARLVVDGVFGPQTDAAVRTCGLLCRRDHLPWPSGLASAGEPAGVC